MVSVKFFRDLFTWLLLITLLVAHGDSVATTNPQAVKMDRIATGYGAPTTGENVVPIHEVLSMELLDAVQAPTTVFRKEKLGGRKILKEERAVLNGDQTSNPSAVTTHSVVSHQTKKELVVDCKLGGRLPPAKTNVAGFIAFSADYHVPKPHPPKNN